jgi:hypothetical protein
VTMQGGLGGSESEVQRSSFERSLNAIKPYHLGQVSTTIQMRTRKPMQGVDGVPSTMLCGCIVTAGLLWLLWSKRVTAVLEAYMEGSPPMRCIARSWLYPPTPFQTGRKQFGEERTDGCLRPSDLCKLNHACTLGPRAAK